MSEFGPSAAIERNQLMADCSSVSDGLEELLQSIQARNVRALEKLRRATTTSLLGIAHRIVMNHADAEEVVSEVYLRVWLRAGRFDPQRGSVRGWLTTMCRHASIDHARKRRAHGGAMLALAWELEDTSSPDASIEREQMKVVLTRALDTLSQAQRQMVVLFYYQEMSQREIAASAGIPLGTVKSHLRRSMQRLHQALQVS